MIETEYDAIVIGAGQAGLAISYFLKQKGLDHRVLEQNMVGSSWAYKRWDTFKFNTPNKYNSLPGMEIQVDDRDGFCSAREFVSYLRHYVDTLKLPVIENSVVTAVEKNEGSDLFLIRAKHSDGEKKYAARNVVIASGSQNVMVTPEICEHIAPGIRQLHAGEYRHSDDLPVGSVMVVGSAQSGVQITEDLVMSGRKVYLSTSKVARIPRRYRGRDLLDWMNLTGYNDHLTTDITDPMVFKMKQPQVSGVGPRGHTVSLQSLNKRGAVILGRLVNASGFLVEFNNDAPENVKFGDSFSAQVKTMIDTYITKSNLKAEPPGEDADDVPDESGACASSITSLNLEEHNIRTIIWATGFIGDFGYLKMPVLHDNGAIKHQNGITEVDGLYAIGFPWLRKRTSGIVLGINDDAQYICETLVGRI